MVQSQGREENQENAGVNTLSSILKRKKAQKPKYH